MRFAKIDTCEIKQKAVTKTGELDCGTWAKLELKTLIAGQNVVCYGDRQDRHLRPVVECKTATIEDIGIAMLERGYAFPYFEERLPRNAQIATQNARKNSLGVWGFRLVQEPFLWRRENTNR